MKSINLREWEQDMSKYPIQGQDQYSGAMVFSK
jgi:hypothetical protein